MVDRVVKTEVKDAARLVTLLAQSRRGIQSWWWLLPLTALSAPCRVPPRRGMPRLGRHEVNVRLGRGAVIRCRIDEAYGLIEVFAMATYDAPEVSWDRVRTILDVGANIGAASIWFALRSPGAKIIAVEPACDTTSRLRLNLARNNLSHLVEVIQSAVAGNPGNGYLVPGINSRLSRTVIIPVADAEPIKFVDLEYLLCYVGGSVDLMKVDCEGGEYDFLMGATSDALARVGAIVGEYHPADINEQSRLFEHLESAGFRCRVAPDVYPGDLEQGCFFAWRDNWGWDASDC